MRTLEIRIDKDDYVPGEEGKGVVIFRIDKTVKTRGLMFRMRGSEKVEARMPYLNGAEDYIIEEHFIVNTIIKLEPAGSITPGEHVYPIRFRVPEEALPSYSGKHSTVHYELKVWVDIPLWPDTKEKRTLTVLGKHEQSEEREKGVVLSSLSPGEERGVQDQGGPAVTEAPVLRVETDREQYFAGEDILCDVKIENPSGREIRELAIHLTATEDIRVKGMSFHRPVETKLNKVKLSSNDNEIHFRTSVHIPENAPASCEGKHFKVTWKISFELIMSSGKAGKLRHVISIYPGVPGTRAAPGT